jgi:hypothetical protein
METKDRTTFSRGNDGKKFSPECILVNSKSEARTAKYEQNRGQTNSQLSEIPKR